MEKNNRVRLWSARPAALCPAQWRGLSDLLDDNERRQAGRFRFAADQCAYVLAHGLRRLALAEWLQVPAASLRTGTLVVDTRDADHEAGDLLQAGIDVSALPTLADVVGQTAVWQRAIHQTPGSRQGPVFFKSCGWGGWDLAAARCTASVLMPLR